MTMSRLRAELITDISGIAPIEDDWRALAEQRSNGFIVPEWFRSWWDHQGHTSSSPLISVVRRSDGSVAGIMPLVLDESSRPRAIRFAGATIGDRFHPAASEADEASVATATMQALEVAGMDHRMVLLECVDTRSRWWRLMQGVSSLRHTIVEQQQTAVSFIDLRGLDWETYLSRRSTNFRKQIRRGERRLVREHAMKLRSATGDTLEADIAELFRLHDLRRNGFGGSSLEASARQTLAAFAIAAHRRGWLRLNLMEVDGAPMAAFLGWRVGDCYVSYQGGFDPAWSKRSVGVAIEAMNIRNAIEEGAAEYDFLLGTEDWKRRFTAEARPTQTAVLLRARRPTRLLVAAEARARRAGSRIHEHKGVSGLVRSMHGLIPTARRS
jgi:CelD/BcsL family acetyltransferase involved in cellulose biosynthesis